ncbi:MAG: right-handed parallel beta-helix repeat-containing protein [Thermoplasmata archaeon]|nr:MAG: right-handed parallel beta-helix repeat-containing protein [Thermoplasmata archaeon]
MGIRFYLNSIPISNSINGIYIWTGNDDTDLAKNTISNNTCGINITQSSNIVIEDNTILYNDNGIELNYSSPIIRYNNISHNNYDGIRNINYSSAIIGNNTLTYNNRTGVVYEYNSIGILDNNTISYNYGGINCSSTSSPVITFNNVTFNSYNIYCLDSADTEIHWNNIHNRTDYSLANLNTSGLTDWLDATHNYWGSSRGPQPGDIIGPVIYRPFEIRPIEVAGPG